MSTDKQKPERTPDSEIDQMIKDFGKKPDPQEKAQLMEYLKKQRGLFQALNPEQDKDRNRGRDR